MLSRAGRPFIKTSASIEELGIQLTTNSPSSTRASDVMVYDADVFGTVSTFSITRQGKARFVVSQKVHRSDGVLKHQFV